MAGALGVGVLVSGFGCQTTTYRCAGDRCVASLEGAGASTELEALVLTLTLEDAGEGAAHLNANGTDVECSEGEVVQVTGVAIACDEIGDDSVDVRAIGR